jgi:hypothetical protein
MYRWATATDPTRAPSTFGPGILHTATKPFPGASVIRQRTGESVAQGGLLVGIPVLGLVMGELLTRPFQVHSKVVLLDFTVPTALAVSLKSSA